jgi:hypothetical protein
LEPGFIVEWKYNPTDFFEELIEDKGDQFSLTIHNGRIDAHLHVQDYEAAKLLREKIESVLRARLSSAQLLSHLPYELKLASIVQIRTDGTKSYIVEVEPAVLTLSAGRPDFTVSNKDGLVLFDSRRARIERSNQLGSLVASRATNDPLLLKLLGSYNSAVKDPANEFVHLFEIREALVAHFGNELIARSKLHISSSDWSKFGRLCNDAPVHQGRHRGKKLNALRPATQVELVQARDIARRLIEGYLAAS